MSLPEKSEIHHVADQEGLSNVDTSEDHISPDAIGGTSDDLPAGYYKSFSFIGIVTAFSLANLSEYLGYILTFNLLSIINEEIGPDPNFVWVATGYTLAVGISWLIWGRLSDLFGRRWFFIGGNLLALVGSILGAAAQNITMLIWCLVFIGLAFPAQMSFSVALAELIPNRHRGYMNGLLFVAAIPASSFGPVIARQLQAHTSAGWRWAYYINIILVGIIVILSYFCYYPPDFGRLHTKVTKTKVIKELDYVGIFLFTGGIALTLTGLNWGGQQYLWTDAHTLGSLIGGLVAMVLFVFWEFFGTKEPLLPMRFLTNLRFVGLLLAASGGTAVFYPINLLWPQQITALYTQDPVTIGWMSCAIGCGIVAGQVTCGLVVKALGHHKLQIFVACTAMAALIAAMAATTQHTKGLAITLVVLGSFAVGYVENFCLIMAPFIMDAKDIGLAVGILSSTRTWVAGIALAIYTSVLNNKLAEFIPVAVVPAVEKVGLSVDTVPDVLKGLAAGSLGDIPGITPSIAASLTDTYQTAYARALRIVYLVSLVFGGLAILGASFAKNADDDFNSGVARKMHGKEVENLEQKGLKAQQGDRAA